MIQIKHVDINTDLTTVRELFWEYLSWANSKLNEEYQISFDIKDMLENDLEHIQKYLPPVGLIYLANHDNQAVGIACMKKIGEDMMEIKRMYVRPKFRKMGVARKLLELISLKAQEENYSLLRLDTNLFMKAAQALYKKMGFKEINPYPESEIPSEYHPYWLFMEKSI